MAKTPYDKNMWVAYPEINPSAKSLWERYKVDPSEIENYKYYGFGEQDVRDRMQENYKRYGVNPHSYGGFEEAMGDLIADIEYAHPDLYEKRWGMKHPAYDEDGIEEDYLKDLAKVRAKHRGGDVVAAEKELRNLWGDVIVPKTSRTLGDVMQEKNAAKKQAEYNKKKFGR